MKAADVMTRQVVTVQPDTEVVEALRLMLSLRISGLPVVDADAALVGIVTEGDFLRRAELDTDTHYPRWLAFVLGQRVARDYIEAHGRRIEEIMTREVTTAHEDTPLADVVALMERARVKRVPVVAAGRVVGIVSRADLLRAVVSAVSRSMAESVTDDDIRRRIAAEVERQPWSPRDTVTVKVNNGVVDLRGLVFHEAGREALRVLVENVPGVKRVDDHLAMIEPMTGSFVGPPGVS
jgi:CBS domain-containing protein